MPAPRRQRRAPWPSPCCYQAASGYRSLTAAKLKKVVAAVAFPDSSKTEVLATARAGDLGVGAICGAAFPAGQAAYHLVENADGADRAVVIVNQTPGVSPVAYADGVRTGTCDSGVNRIRVKGLLSRSRRRQGRRREHPLRRRGSARQGRLPRPGARHLRNGAARRFGNGRLRQHRPFLTHRIPH
nr:hypothetical protein GCM10020092_076960 [Actinoplanes digitatis]